MVQTSECQMRHISAHIIGNKYNEEELLLSKKPLEINDAILNEILQEYF